jgi:hypothetical protein
MDTSYKFSPVFRVTSDKEYLTMIDNWEKNVVYIDMKELDETPGPFCMSFGFTIEKLVSSIKKIGLVNLPYVRRNRSNSFDIVAGYRRIIALKALSWHLLPCVDLSDSGLNEERLYLFNLYENICTRNFNYVEKSMILNQLSSFFCLEEIHEIYLNNLDILSKREADIIKRIYALPEGAKHIIAKGTIPISIIDMLLEFSESTIIMILKWITELKLNINQQRLLIELIEDISIRENCNISEILKEEIFSQLVHDQRNTPQKAKKFIEIIKAKRYPILTTNEKAFGDLVSNLNLPKGVKINHAPFFEGPYLSLEINFKDGNELKKKIESLNDLKNLSEITVPWNKKE